MGGLKKGRQTWLPSRPPFSLSFFVSAFFFCCERQSPYLIFRLCFITLVCFFSFSNSVL